MKLTDTRIPVWIDTDPSVARGGHEVDDGFALIQAFHSPELEVRGVSVVYGNAPLDTAWPIGREIVEKFGPKALRAYRGAASNDDLGKETDASRALAHALRTERLSVLAIGPVTNIATVLKLHPELAKNFIRIVAVAGRRPGQRFTYSPRQDHAFRDFNFELDPAGFQILLDSGIPLVLVPWEISSKVWITREDLNRLSKGGPAAQFLVPAALDWLAWWITNIGTQGFNPFDTLAVAYLTSPSFLQCSELRAEIVTAPDDVSPDASAKMKPYLQVSDRLKSGPAITYCYNAGPEFKEYLLQRLLRKSEQ
jgi:pyrimidine-specific ribonucleoside hydrolase